MTRPDFLTDLQRHAILMRNSVPRGWRNIRHAGPVGGIGGALWGIRNVFCLVGASLLAGLGAGRLADNFPTTAHI